MDVIRKELIEGMEQMYESMKVISGESWRGCSRQAGGGRGRRIEWTGGPEGRFMDVAEGGRAGGCDDGGCSGWRQMISSGIFSV